MNRRVYVVFIRCCRNWMSSRYWFVLSLSKVMCMTLSSPAFIWFVYAFKKLLGNLNTKYCLLFISWSTSLIDGYPLSKVKMALSMKFSQYVVICFEAKYFSLDEHGPNFTSRNVSFKQSWRVDKRPLTGLESKSLDVGFAFIRPKMASFSFVLGRMILEPSTDSTRWFFHFFISSALLS